MRAPPHSGCGGDPRLLTSGFALIKASGRTPGAIATAVVGFLNDPLRLVVSLLLIIVLVMAGWTALVHRRTQRRWRRHRLWRVASP